MGTSWAADDAARRSLRLLAFVRLTLVLPRASLQLIEIRALRLGGVPELPEKLVHVLWLPAALGRRSSVGVSSMTEGYPSAPEIARATSAGIVTPSAIKPRSTSAASLRSRSG